MEIGVKQAAELLNVSDKTIYRWVSAGQVPFYRVGAQYRFSRQELLAWAAAGRSVAAAEDGEPIALSLEKGLRAGGIFYRVGGGTVREVLAQMLELVRLPAGIDPARVLERLYEREQLTTTGVGDGIAFPHCRDLALPGLAAPIVALGFLEQPVDFASIDRKPVEIVFVLLSPTARASIRMMSRLAYAIRQAAVQRLLHDRGSREALLAAFAAVDRELDG